MKSLPCLLTLMASIGVLFGDQPLEKLGEVQAKFTQFDHRAIQALSVPFWQAHLIGD